MYLTVVDVEFGKVFAEIPIGGFFVCNGEWYCKSSPKRTRNRAPSSLSNNQFEADDHEWAEILRANGWKQPSTNDFGPRRRVQNHDPTVHGYLTNHCQAE